MIFDGFLFFNELDLLEVRLEELYPVVNKFILVESYETFRGNKKPLYYNNNKYRFDKYNDKIIHIVLESNNFSSPWDREKWSRKQIMRGFGHGNPNDILIVSDLDEIPRREIVRTLDFNDIVRLQTINFSLFINAVEGYGAAIKAVRRFYAEVYDLQTIRENSETPLLRDAGWSFSSIGTPEHISEKLKAYSHSELDLPEYTSPAQIERRMGDLTDLFDRGTLERVKVDGTWPKAIVNNRDYWSKYEC